MIRSPDFIPRKNSLSADPGQLLTPDLLKMPKRPTQKAELVNASHEMYGDGLEAAKEFLASRNSPYTIDEELSTRDAIVATDEQGRPHIAFRGTEPGRTSSTGERVALYDISA